MCNDEPMSKPVMPGPNPEAVRADQERRRSSAAQPHRSKKAYTRKRKHRKADNDG